MNKKRRHHYVWRHYLRAWADKDDLIYCLRTGKIFKPNLMGVAQERYFYRLKELSVKEVTFIEKVFLNSFPKHLRELNRDWIEIFNRVFWIRKELEVRGVLDEEWEKFLDLTVNDFEEEVHAKVEEDSIKYLAAIKAEEMSFLMDDLDYADFLFFLCLQFLRTKKMKATTLSVLGSVVTDVNLEAVLGILKYMFATNMSWSLYTKRASMKLYLLKNTTPEEFITGDQPVVNTFATGALSNELVAELELYYPVSPTTGVLLTNCSELSQGKTIVLSESEVALYNNHIIQNSHEQLYASTQESLEQILRN